MRHKSFYIALSDSDRIRVKIYKSDGRVIEFVVQFESLIEGRWREIIRYDNRDKPPHRDVYDVKGKRYKNEIPNVTPESLIPWCIKDIKENWMRYKGRYLKWML